MPTTNLTPVWTDDVAILGPAVLAKGAEVRGTWDLSAARGGRLFIDLGKGGASALSDGATVRIKEMVNGATITRPGGRTRSQSKTTANSTTVNGDSAVGGNTLNVASVTGFAKGDMVCIQDSGGGVTRLEWRSVSKTAAGVLTLGGPLLFTHTAAQADTVRNQADSFSSIWLPGGTQYEIIVDYLAETTGDSITYRVLGQVYLKDQAVSA